MRMQNWVEARWLRALKPKGRGIVYNVNATGPMKGVQPEGWNVGNNLPLFKKEHWCVTKAFRGKVGRYQVAAATVQVN